MTRVFVTGMGVVSALGHGVEPYWKALCEGRSGASRVERFDTASMGRDFACEIKDFRPRDFLTAGEARRTGRCSAYAIAAARMAVEQSGLGEGTLSGDRTTVIVGTTMGEANVMSELESAWIHKGYSAVAANRIPLYGSTLLSVHVARAFGARGALQTLPAACAAGNYAIGFAADLIRSGRADIAITGATEILEKLQFAGFVRLGAVAPERVQPFDKNRRGLLVGEGAGMMVLESEASVVRRGGTALAELGGYGLACDAHHITRPHPEGAGSIVAMRRAIESSGLTVDDVDFINAHGTGTDANDKIEAMVTQMIFGDRPVPITSTKSMLGHCMGAASALEAVQCVKTIETGIYPPTMNYETPDPECPVHVVANQARAGKHDVVLNNALAFGGYDAVLCFAKIGRLPAGAGMSA